MTVTLIIDGNNAAHRAKHAFSLTHPRTGADVSVTYGFLRMLLSSIKQFHATSVVVCWDGGIPAHRIHKVPEYKANREIGDEIAYMNLRRQMLELDRVLPLCGVVSIRKIGAEADDLMYHASRVVSRGDRIIISTDADMLQAASGSVVVYNPIKNLLATPKDIEEVYGVHPRQLPHLRALCGDSSDNIGGIRGIGSKTAIKLFKEFGNLSAIYNAAREKKGSLRGSLGCLVAAYPFSKLTDAVDATKLWQDRTGSRLACLDAIDAWEGADKRAIHEYMMANAFVSLLGELSLFSKLEKPAVCTLAMRLPVFCARRIRS